MLLDLTYSSVLRRTKANNLDLVTKSRGTKMHKRDCETLPTLVRLLSTPRQHVLPAAEAVSIASNFRRG